PCTLSTVRNISVLLLVIRNAYSKHRAWSRQSSTWTSLLHGRIAGFAYGCCDGGCVACPVHAYTVARKVNIDHGARRGVLNGAGNGGHTMTAGHVVDVEIKHCILHEVAAQCCT